MQHREAGAGAAMLAGGDLRAHNRRCRVLRPVFMGWDRPKGGYDGYRGPDPLINLAAEHPPGMGGDWLGMGGDRGGKLG